MNVSVKEVPWEEGGGFSWSVYVADVCFAGKVWVEETAVSRVGNKLRV